MESDRRVGLHGVESLLITGISVEPFVIPSKDAGAVPALEGMPAWEGI